MQCVRKLKHTGTTIEDLDSGESAYAEPQRTGRARDRLCARVHGSVCLLATGGRAGLRGGGGGGQDGLPEPPSSNGPLAGRSAT